VQTHLQALKLVQRRVALHLCCGQQRLQRLQNLHLLSEQQHRLLQLCEAHGVYSSLHRCTRLG
jgi:hypothetical protein